MCFGKQTLKEDVCCESSNEITRVQGLRDTYRNLRGQQGLLSTLE